MGLPQRPAPAASEPEVAFDANAIRAQLDAERLKAPSPDKEAYALYLSGRVKLPPIPKVATLLLPMLRKQDVPVAECTKLMEMDLALVSSMLRAANSVAYMRGQQVTNLHDAVMRIGLREAACLALSLSTRALYDGKVRAAMKFVTADSDEQWRRSVIVAQSARAIANQIRRGDPDLAYAAGLFQGVGTVLSIFVLAQLSLQDPKVAAMPLEERKAAVIRMRQIIMGEYLMREGLPAELCAVSAQLTFTGDEPVCDLANVVRLTQGLVAGLLGEKSEKVIWLQRAFASAGALGIGRSRLGEVKEQIIKAKASVDSLGTSG